MGEISFNYNVNTEPIQEAAFKYWFHESIEYSFAYQRYIAFSDASIFNSPVAITKVATGLSQLYGLFADREIGCAVYINLIKSLQELQSGTEKEDILFGELQKGNTNEYATTLTKKAQSSNTNILEDAGLKKDTLIANKNKDTAASKDIATIHLNTIFSSKKNIDTGTSYINLRDYWATKYNLLNIYDSFLVNRINDATLDAYQQIFAVTDKNKLNILKDIQTRRVHDSILSTYEVLFGAPFRTGFNIIENISGQTPDDILNTLQNTSLSPFDNEFNILPNISVSPREKVSANILKIYLGSYDRLKMNVLYNTLAQKPNVIKINIIRQIFGSTSDLLGNINPIISGSRPINTLNTTHGDFCIDSYENIVTQSFVTGYQYGKTSGRFNGTSTVKTSKEVSVPNSILGIDHNAKHIFTVRQYSVHLYEKPLCYFDLDTFVVSEKKYCITLNGIMVDKNLKTTQQDAMMRSCFKSGKSVYTTDNLVLDSNGKQIMTSPMVYTIKDGKVIDTDRHQVFIFNKGVPVSFTNKMLRMDKSEHYIDTYTQYFINKNSVDIGLFSFTSIGKFGSEMVLYPQQDTVAKGKALMDIYQDQSFIHKGETPVEIYSSQSDVHRERKSFVINDNTIFIDRDKYCLDMEQLDGLSVEKIAKSMLLQGNIAGIYRESYEMYLFSDIWTDRSVYGMSWLEQYSVDKTEYYASVFEQGQSLIKKLTIISVPDFDSVIKNNIPVDYANTLTDSFAGMIIPLSKIKRQAYIDGINLMVQKVSKNGYIHQDSTASVIPRDTYVQGLDLFCDKKEFNTYVDYKNIHITRSKIQTFIGKNEFLKKTPVYMALEGSIWVDKESRRIWSDEQLQVQKKARRGFLDGIISIIRGNRDIYANDSLFVDKKDQMCYYDYGMTWLDKPLIDAKIQSQLTLDRKDRLGHMFDCVSPIIRKDLEGFYDYGVFGSRAIQESGLFQQIHDVHKKAYDTGIRPEDFGNWVWVYETPDPFDNGFGIDELLLPENDTRYEDFEDIIFDKENMRPRNPVKEINENTFIAKYPIRHPLPKYKNIGIDYDKGAVKLDQFYGIETSVMHAVFLKFYRIWQAKIFEFGTMTMVQSVKTMLEYLYAWIMEYFPLEEIEQALRVFRLIRWYGETSIIQNSQYIVSYEYDTLESKLNTGTCLIPNDLDTQDTMYVDATLGVIRNNPTYINSGPAYVTFEVNNRKNSTFTFSLSNTVGSVNIYINDVLVDTISKSALNLTYELPYTGDTNVVKIEKPAAHNLNGTFYIGNIKVPNCTFKELSIEFDPNLKAGNKPLNEIARKMISYANLYEDREAAYEIIRKGNLGVGEIYKRLTEYWELHHQDKTKGKRLTIKEV